MDDDNRMDFSQPKIETPEEMARRLEIERAEAKVIERMMLLADLPAKPGDQATGRKPSRLDEEEAVAATHALYRDGLLSRRLKQMMSNFESNNLEILQDGLPAADERDAVCLSMGALHVLVEVGLVTGRIPGRWGQPKIRLRVGAFRADEPDGQIRWPAPEATRSLEIPIPDDEGVRTAEMATCIIVAFLRSALANLLEHEPISGWPYPADPEPPAKPAEDKGPAHQRIRLYDVDDVRRAVNDLSEDDSDSGKLATTLREITAKGDEGAMRDVLVADEAMTGRIEEQARDNPHFGAVYAHIRAAAALSMRAAAPMAMQPVIMVGTPGIGKSHALRRLASAMGIRARVTQMNLQKLSDPLVGLSRHWRAGGQGEVAAELLGGRSSAALFLLDEFDKPQASQWNADPYSAFYTLLEPENARAFRDEYLFFPMRADHILWLASANGLSSIPGPILDRCRILKIERPDTATARRVIASIWSDLNAEANGAFPAELPEAVVTALEAAAPRAAKAALRLAMGRASLAGTDLIAVAMLGETYRSSLPKTWAVH